LDWGDGTTQAVPATGASTPASHVFANSGTYRVTAVARDQAGDVSTAATLSGAITAAALPTDPPDTSKTVLVVGGTTGGDTLLVTPGASAGTLTVTLNGVSTTYAAPAGHPFSRLIVFGQAGDDVLQVSNRVLVDSELHGNAGNDVLIG